MLRIGWEGAERRRALDLRYEDRGIVADFADNTLTERRADGQDETQVFPERPNALLSELRAFASAVRGADTRYPDAAVGERIVRIAARSEPVATGRWPRVAVIGGGIFGATCASELGKEADVSLFERHGELMQEASLVNQRRHHQGFRYPRSYATVAEIRNAQESFLSEYGEALVEDMPVYACGALKLEGALQGHAEQPRAVPGRHQDREPWLGWHGQPLVTSRMTMVVRILSHPGESWAAAAGHPAGRAG